MTGGHDHETTSTSASSRMLSLRIAVMPSLPTVFAVFFLLSSCCCWTRVGAFDASGGCPGVDINNHYYVTDKHEIMGCTYSITGHYPFPATVNKLAEFTCLDRKRNMYCTGYLINPDYAFWDNVNHQYIDPPDCPKTISTCGDMDDVCVAGGARECKWNHYVCQAKDLVKAVLDENGTAVKEFEWCKGAIVKKKVYNCPPKTVASFDDVSRYCGDKGYVVNETEQTEYRCEADETVVCQGIIDPTMLPLCTRQATDCSPGARSQVCKLQLHPAHEEFCGAYFVTNSDGVVEFKDNRLMCADRLHPGTWCMSIMRPGSTANLVADETCPSDPLEDCGAVQRHFLHPEFCRCIAQNDTGKIVGFECYTDGRDTPWCTGKIEPSSQTKIEDLCDGDKGCKAGVSVSISFGVLIVTLILVYCLYRYIKRRNYRRRHLVSTVDQDLAAFGNSLELKDASTEAYSDDPLQIHPMQVRVFT